MNTRNTHTNRQCRTVAPIVTAAVGLAGLWLAGCQSSVDLQPIAQAQGVEGLEDTASARTQNVTLQVEADAWPGQSEVTQHVTPLRIEIENESDRPLKIRYEDFALVDERTGNRYAALPPFSIDDDIEEPAIAYNSAVDPIGFRHANFRLAQSYSVAYPGLSYWGAPFPYDPSYYDHYYNYWVDIPLPTQEMIQQVIPEGVIEPGGSLSGFIYFEQVPADLERVELHFELSSAETGERFGMISIPFRVEEG